jgi:5S rRNA maturation endonuclease (ribonuclease M5)
VTAQIGTFEELLDLCTVRLGAGQRSGRSWRFVCPLHDDVNPSLVISPGDDGRALAYCHGCVDGRVYPRLLDWLRDGDQTSPIAGKPKGTGGGRVWSAAPLGRVVGQYEFHHADGQPVALKLRHEPKDFRWRGYRAGAYMDTGLGNVERLPCLYRMHKIAERAKETGEVTLVEGEKDADRLWALGVAATCTPYGSTWPVDGVVEFIAGLGLPVRVIRDKDDKGYAWAAGVHRDLNAAGVSTSVWETPLVIKGGDVSDHLDNGLGLDWLVAVDMTTPRIGPVDPPVSERGVRGVADHAVEPFPSSPVIDQPPPASPGKARGVDGGQRGGSTAQPETPRYRSVTMTNVKTRPTEYLIENLLPRADLVVAVGEEGIGKGLWWCHLVANLTQRDEHVTLICAEDDYARVVRPRLEVAGAVLDNVHLLVEDVDTLTGHPRLPAHTSEVADLIKATGTALLIIDPWVSTVGGLLRLRDTQDARAALDPLTIMARLSGATILAVAHPNRGEGSLRDKVGLTAALRQTARVLIFAIEDPEDDSVVYVGVEKANQMARQPAEKFVKTSRSHPIAGQVWMVVPQGPTQRTIREWDDYANDVRDHRVTERWELVETKARSDGGVIARVDIVAIYVADGSTAKAADKAISRWRGKRLRSTDEPGIYELTRSPEPFKPKAKETA